MSSKEKLSKLLQQNLLLERDHPCSVDTEKDFFCAYVGPSMHPTLKEGDLLEVTTYEKHTPQVGDVILFLPPGQNNPIVHRIIQNNNGTFRTRGDNCSHVDPWDIELEMIIGRITGAVRGKWSRNVTRGLPGRFQASWCRTYNLLIPKLSMSMKTTFKTLHAHKLLNIITFPEKRLHSIRFINGGTPLHRLMLGTKHIGHYDTVASKWQIKFPYRFLFKQTSLPKV